MNNNYTYGNNFFKIDGTEYTVDQAAAGTWTVTVSEPFKEDETYCGFESEAEALKWILEYVVDKM